MANEMAKKNEMAAGNGKQPRAVDLIITHIRPHFDEVLAIYLLKAFGENFFPGVSNASVETWGEGKMLKEYSGKTPEDLLLEQKMLFIGTCGGEFDEHNKKAYTCAHLVAEFLGIAEKPELQTILQFCKRVDHDGKSMPFDLHSTMKDMYQFIGDDDYGMQIIFDWATQAIHSHIYGQILFYACANEFKITGRIINGPIKIALVESDSPKMNKWIRYFHSADVIVQKKSSGNIIILTSIKRAKKIIDIRDLARIIRTFELRKRNKKTLSWQTLEVPGTVEECPWWYYYTNGEQLLNGTSTSPEVEPTALSLDEAAQAIILACALKIEPCDEENCIETCRRYGLGLIACRQKRFIKK